MIANSQADIEDAAKRVLAARGMSWEPDCSVRSALAKLGNEVDLLRQRLGVAQPTRLPDRTHIERVVNPATGKLQDREYRYWDEPSGLLGSWVWR